MSDELGTVALGHGRFRFVLGSEQGITAMEVVRRLEAKYGISYDTIEYLLDDELPAVLPDELLA